MKMLSLTCVILLFVLGTGCFLIHVADEPRLGAYEYTRMESGLSSAPQVISIWVDQRFGEADRLAIQDAVSAWNYSLNGYIKLRIVDWQFDMEIPKIQRQVREGGWLFMKIESGSPIIPPSDKGYQTDGFVDRIGGSHLYLVRDIITNRMVFGITLHEVGHLLGAGHVGSRLMHRHYTEARNRCIDRETMEAVATYRNLPADRLNYCVDKNSDQIMQTPLDGAGDAPGCRLGSYCP